MSSSDSRLSCYCCHEVTLPPPSTKPLPAPPQVPRIVVPPPPLHTCPAPASHMTLGLLLPLQPTGPETPRLYCVGANHQARATCPPPLPGSHGCGVVRRARRLPELRRRVEEKRRECPVRVHLHPLDLCRVGTEPYARVLLQYYLGIRTSLNHTHLVLLLDREVRARLLHLAMGR